MRRRTGAAAAPHAGPSPPREPAPTIDLEAAGSTPILREYRAVKAEHPGAIVLARLGDFYEMFGDDAERAAPLLGVTLTGRGFGSAGRLPMCGVPHHSATQHVRRLLGAGLRVVLWDQVGGPDEAAETTGRALVRRDVTRILTPGTLLDDDFLEASTAVRCVALAPRPGRVGVAALDVSTGDLQLAECPGGLETAGLAEELDRLAAAELLLPEGIEVGDGMAASAPRTRVPPAHFDAARGEERLRDLAGVATLRGLGADAMPAAHAAAAALLAYCERSRIALDAGFVRVRTRPNAEGMRLDAPTRRNLELTASPGGAGGLVVLLDRTVTPMGARLLREELLLPLTRARAIEGRLDGVEALVRSRDARRRLRDALRPIRDLERLCGRCVQRLASPRDLAALATGLSALDEVRAAARSIAAAPGGDGTPAPEVLETAAATATAPDGLVARLRATLVDDPPATTRDGGAVRPGADAVLDSLVAAGAGAREYIGSLEDAERVRTGIRSLRVGYNRVFGYYLEVPNAHRSAVPGEWVRKQTLVGAERYVTDKLREQEAVVLGSRDRALAREVEILAELAAVVAA
ncbi:MAG TPA: DNA mismatch repair protein MutS, partial [Candidatus Dormibacteraeota bacterium]|nr:DNA mismatch repair protein MutS [Candidatus Dormibacteraeota bacterium]